MGDKINMRKNIYDILNTQAIDLKKEYSRIYELFYNTFFEDGLDSFTIYDAINNYFLSFDKSLTKRCLSLNDFNEEFGFRFDEQPDSFDIDYLVSFAEYVTNFVFALVNTYDNNFDNNELFKVIEHIEGCMEDIGYIQISKENIYIFVEKDPCAIAVAENVNDSLAYSVLQYNHFRLKGDLDSKVNILRAMALEIEVRRNDLKALNKQFTSDFFQLINKFIRHNNEKNDYIASLPSEELEAIYDDIYQMWLYANMMLSQYERKDRIADIIKMIN